MMSLTKTNRTIRPHLKLPLGLCLSQELGHMHGQDVLNFWERCSFDSVQDLRNVAVLLGLEATLCQCWLSQGAN